MNVVEAVVVLAEMSFWFACAFMVFALSVLGSLELRSRSNERAQLRAEILKAERQLNSLAVAAFSEMLEVARLSREAPAPHPSTRLHLFDGDDVA